MENEKTLAEQEIEILGLINLVLNSRRSWAAIERIMGRLEARLAKVRAARDVQEAGGLAPYPVAIEPNDPLQPRFESCREAAVFLEAECGLLVLSIQSAPALWWIVSAARDYSAAFDGAELIELASQALRQRLRQPETAHRNESLVIEPQSTNKAAGGAA